MRGREDDLQSAEGVIVKGVGGLYYARGEDGGTHVLRARGIFRRRHITPMVGDRVRFTPGQGEEHGWVEEILPRESQLVRPPVANVRYLVIVLAPAPAPDYLLIDTLIAMALRQGIRPALVVNKCDLDGGTYEAVRSDYAGLGAPLLAVSALSGQGMDGLRSLLASGVCCLAGQSAWARARCSALPRVSGCRPAKSARRSTGAGTPPAMRSCYSAGSTGCWTRRDSACWNCGRGWSPFG